MSLLAAHGAGMPGRSSGADHCTRGGSIGAGHCTRLRRTLGTAGLCSRCALRCPCFSFLLDCSSSFLRADACCAALTAPGLHLQHIVLCVHAPSSMCASVPRAPCATQRATSHTVSPTKRTECRSRRQGLCAHQSTCLATNPRCRSSPSCAPLATSTRCQWLRPRGNRGTSCPVERCCCSARTAAARSQPLPRRETAPLRLQLLQQRLQSSARRRQAAAKAAVPLRAAKAAGQKQRHHRGSHSRAAFSVTLHRVARAVRPACPTGAALGLRRLQARPTSPRVRRSPQVRGRRVRATPAWPRPRSSRPTRSRAACLRWCCQSGLPAVTVHLTRSPMTWPLCSAVPATPWCALLLHPLFAPWCALLSCLLCFTFMCLVALRVVCHPCGWWTCR